MDVKQTNEIKEIEIYIDLSSMTLEKDFEDFKCQYTVPCAPVVTGASSLL